MAQIDFMRQMSTAYGLFHILQPGVAGISSIKNRIKKRRRNERRRDERRKKDERNGAVYRLITLPNRQRQIGTV